MSNVFATDHPLTAAQQQTLRAIVDAILPASDDGQMPGAGELDFIGYLNENAAELVPTLGQIVDSFDAGFPELSASQRYERVTDFSNTQAPLFEQLLFHLYCCYYQDDRALEGLGLASGPPFPRGNTVEAGDLALLDQVVQKPRSYRK